MSRKRKVTRLCYEGGQFTAFAEHQKTGANTAYAQGSDTGSITAFAKAGDSLVTVTDASHGLSNGDSIVISGTTNYNGTFTVSGATTNTFLIDAVFVETETGTWVKQPYVTTVTDVAHGLVTGDVITITGTTSYNGTFTVTKITDDTYTILTAFVADDGTGTWSTAASTTCTTDAAHGLSNGDSVVISGTTNYNGTFVIQEVAASTFVILDAYVADDATGMYLVGTAAQDVSMDAENYDHAIMYTVVSDWNAGSLVPSLEASPDEGTTWLQVAAGASIGSATSQFVTVSAPIGKLVRVVATRASSPMFDFKIWLELSRTGSQG